MQILARFLLLAALLAQLSAAPALAQTSPRPDSTRLISALRVAQPPAVDGLLDDPAWVAAPVASGFTQTRPHPGTPATERTEVRVLYDDRALYVGARLYDSRPDSVVGRLARRDQDVYSDGFAVGVDSYHDRRTAFVFAVNPRGVQRDLLIAEDSREDAGWDAVWEAATRTDSLGWTAELRIPLSQLRFRPGARSWGINFERRLARRDERSHWAPLPPDAAGVVSRYGTLTGLRDLRPPRRLEVQPYTAARVTRAPGEAGDPFHTPAEWLGSAGADLKYGLSSEFTLTATLNPDFGQVEADPSQVNLTAFESYFEEKRPFFTEGAEIFGAGWPQLFYSRRIGRAPQGRLPGGARFADAPDASTILGAAKLTGKTAGGWSIGLLEAVTAPEHARHVNARGEEGRTRVEPLTHYTVSRVSRDFREGRSALGGVLTATHRRLGDAEGLQFLRAAAYAGGVDGRHRFGGGSYELSGALLGSLVRGSDTAIARLQRAPGHSFHRPDAPHLGYDPGRESLGGYAARAGVGKRGGGHWRWEVYGHAFSPGFEVNDLGFHSGSDELREYAMVGYEQFRPGRLFRNWTLNLGQMAEWTFGGERRDAAADAFFRFQLTRHWGGYVWYMRRAGGLSPDALRGGPAVVWPARQMGSFSLHTDRRRPLLLRLGGAWEVEDGTGGRELSVNTSATLRAGQRMELSLRPSLARNVSAWQYVGSRADAHAGGERRYLVGRLEQTTASLTTRLDYAFTPALSLQLYAQPFLSAGDYSDFRELGDPRAAAFGERFRLLGAEELRECAGFYGVRPRREGCAATGEGAAFAYRFSSPDFNVRELRSNAVLRWEYRPGSTLFVVWSQGRSHFEPDGRFDAREGMGDLLRAPGTNVLLVKLSYWMSL
jgi:hypothetical protein